MPRARDPKRALREARRAIADGRPADAMLVIGHAALTLGELDRDVWASLAALAKIAVTSVLSSRVLH